MIIPIKHLYYNNIYSMLQCKFRFHVSNFIVFILLFLYFQKLSLLNFIVFCYIFHLCKGKFTLVLFWLFLINILIRVISFIQNNLIKRKKIKMNELKPGDILIWRNKYNYTSYPMFDVLDLTTLFAQKYRHILIVGNNNYIYHSVLPNSNKNRNRLSNWNLHFYEKIKINKFIEKYYKYYHIEVIPIKKKIKLKNINYLNLKTKGSNFMNNIIVYTTIIINNLNFHKQIKKEKEVFNCVDYVHKILELNNLEDNSSFQGIRYWTKFLFGNFLSDKYYSKERYKLDVN